jgi:hypothetical protein
MLGSLEGSGMMSIALVLAMMAAAPAEESRARRNAELDYSDILAAYALCEVRDYHARSAKAVLSNLDAHNLEHDFSDIFIEKPVAFVAGCRELVIPDRQAFFLKGEALRMKLAEALVKADLKNETSTSFADRAPLPMREPETREELDRTLANTRTESGRRHVREVYDMRVAQSWLSHFGECVARSDPARVHAWLLTNADTAEDATATKALAPAFGACLSEGRKLTASRDVLRGTVAVDYYRLAKAPEGLPVKAQKLVARVR